MKEFQVDGDFIKLDQLLKAADIASSGGEAKILIASELIRVNDEIVTQRGKKIRKGDKVQFEDQIIKVL